MNLSSNIWNTLLCSCLQGKQSKCVKLEQTNSAKTSFHSPQTPLSDKKRIIYTYKKGKRCEIGGLFKQLSPP